EGVQGAPARAVEPHRLGVDPPGRAGLRDFFDADRDLHRGRTLFIGRRRTVALRSGGAQGGDALAALEAGLALVDERAHAFLLVLGREERGEQDRLVGQARAEVALERTVGGVLRGRQRDRALRRQAGRRLE